MKFKVGQILTSNEEVVVEKALSGEKVVIPKGNKIIIGADKLADVVANKEALTINVLNKDGSVKNTYTFPAPKK